MTSSSDRVQRRIRDLREQLVKIVVQESRALGKHRQRRVGAHGTGRLLAVRGHRLEDQVDVLAGVPERPLAAGKVLVRHHCGRRPNRQILQPAQAGIEPCAIGLAGGEVVLDLLVLDDPLLLEIDEKHAAGFEAPAPYDVLRRHVQHAGLRRQDHATVLRHRVARRAQAVAVQHGAQMPPIGKRDRGGTVPWLHLAGMKLVEGLLLPAHRLVILPRLGDQRHDGMRQRPARMDQQFHRVVQDRRIAAARRQRGPDLRKILAERLAPEEPLARVEPVEISAHGVDLAVVTEEAERVRKIPRGKGIGAVPLVDQRETGRHRRVRKVAKEPRDLVGQQQALVHEDARRHRGNVEAPPLREARLADPSLEDLARHVELALEGRSRGHIRAATDERLAHDGQGAASEIAKDVRIRRHVAPAEKDQPLREHNAFGCVLDRLPLPRIRRQEDHADPVVPGFRQPAAPDAEAPAQHGVRHLDQDSRAVAGARVRSRGATMRQVDENLEAVLDDPAGRAIPDVRHEADAAGIVLERRVVESLRRRDPGGRYRLLHGWWNHRSKTFPPAVRAFASHPTRATACAGLRPSRTGSGR